MILRTYVTPRSAKAILNTDDAIVTSGSRGVRELSKGSLVTVIRTADLAWCVCMYVYLIICFYMYVCLYMYVCVLCAIMGLKCRVLTTDDEQKLLQHNVCKYV